MNKIFPQLQKVKSLFEAKIPYVQHNITDRGASCCAKQLKEEVKSEGGSEERL